MVVVFMAGVISYTSDWPAGLLYARSGGAAVSGHTASWLIILLAVIPLTYVFRSGYAGTVSVLAVGLAHEQLWNLAYYGANLGVLQAGQFPWIVGHVLVIGGMYFLVVRDRGLCLAASLAAFGGFLIFWWSLGFHYTYDPGSGLATMFLADPQTNLIEIAGWAVPVAAFIAAAYIRAAHKIGENERGENDKFKDKDCHRGRHPVRIRIRIPDTEESEKQ